MKLSLVTAPHPALKRPAASVDPTALETAQIVDFLKEKIQEYGAYGLNAPMFGQSQQIIVVRSSPEDPNLLVMLNPKVLDASEERQAHLEASPSFPGIEATVSRPLKIKISYQDLQDQDQELAVEGFLATVILHQLDNLQGKSFMDHLSSLKKQLLLRKMNQVKKEALKGHVHGPHCRHS